MTVEQTDEALRPHLIEIGERGMEVDRVRLDSTLDQLAVKVYDLRQSLANVVQNPNSTQQVRAYLDSIGIKTKSVAQEVLSPLAQEYDEVARIMMYRKMHKQFSMLNSFDQAIGPFDDRIRYKFRIDHGTTGRIYVTDYNLQQLPPLGRNCIIPDRDSFVVMDFKQFDLRLLAADSGDKILCEAFLNDIDPYVATAQRIFETEDVTPEHRAIAKVVNLAISYGANPNGLAFNLGVTKDQATEIYDRFVEAHSELVEWTREIQDQAIATGQAENRFGRIFPLDLSNEETARRQAIAMRGQGGSADVLRERLLMLCVNKINWSMTVHDSVVFDLSSFPEQLAAASILSFPIPILRGEYQARDLPLDVKISSGPTWGQAGHREELEQDRFGVA